MSRLSGSVGGEFATRARALYPRRLLCGAAFVAGCLALGCSIKPVVTAPQADSTLYDDCARAAQGYCELVVGASDADLESCVANYTFQCVAGVAD
jgi:hypothetical protein